MPRLVSQLIIDYSASRRLVVNYFASAARPGASARREAHRQLLRFAQARRRLLCLGRASRCLGTSRGSSRGSSLTTSLRAGSSSTTSPTLRVRVPRHVARLVKRLIVDYFALSRLSSITSPPPRVPAPRHVVRLVVDYSASRRLVVDYFASAARPGASAHRAARRRLLRLRRASGCLSTSRGSSRGSSRRSSSTTLPRAGS
jgi:hypothetical protein